MKKAQGDFVSQIHCVFATSGNAPDSKRELNSCSKRCEKHTTISAAPDPNTVENISLCISHPLSHSLSLSRARALALALSLISVAAINKLLLHFWSSPKHLRGETRKQEENTASCEVRRIAVSAEPTTPKTNYEIAGANAADSFSWQEPNKEDDDEELRGRSTTTNLGRKTATTGGTPGMSPTFQHPVPTQGI